MELDDLYGLPFDRFVPERAALAKALRADKRRDEAAEVAALRKPSVTAWAVNQLVRTRGPAIEELFEAGDALRGAQADLLAGRGDGRMLRTAAEREREAVERLVADAGRLPISERAQLSGAVVERIADTLHAAALDEDAREQVRGGRLERELRHVGLGLGLGLGESPGAAPVPAVRRARPAEGDASADDAARAARPAEEDARRVAPPAGGEAGAPAKPAPRAKGDAGGRAAGGAARTERGAEERAAERERIAAERAARQRLEREREQARKAARAAETAARHRAERADRAVRNAEERRERAAQALAAADDALATAREEAEAAAREHQRAQADHGRR
jgi:hypothetical protein